MSHTKITLRQKALLLVSVTFSSLMGILYVTASTVMLQGYADLEQQDTQKNVQRVLAAYHKRLDELRLFNSSWGAWDDTYNFVQSPDPVYIETNVIGDLNLEIHTDVFVLLNLSREVVLARGYDPARRGAITSPDSLLKYLRSHPNLLSHSSIDRCHQGLALLPEGPMMIVSCPIVTSSFQGPIRGAVVMGRLIDTMARHQLTETTRLGVKIHRLDQGDPFPLKLQDIRQRLLQNPSTIISEPQDQATVSGYTLVKDVSGQPVLILQVDIPREIFLQGQRSAFYLLVALVIFGVLGGITTQCLLERLIQFWQRQQESQRALEKSESTSRALLEAIPDLIIRVHRDGTLLDFIPAKHLRTIVPHPDMKGRNIRGLTPRSHVEQRLYYMERALETQETQVYEFEMTVAGETWYEETRIAVSGEDEVLVIVRDITERKKAEAALQESQQRLAWQAKHDPLTGLINRFEFERLIKQTIAFAQSDTQHHVLGYLDLDQFKIVNDTCGHPVGDELLRQVTTLLKSQIRSTDVLARLGGDEFGLLLHACDVEVALQIANQLRQSIRDFRFVWQDKVFAVGISVGLVSIDPACHDLATVLSAADAACYIAKNRGRNRVHLYQADDRELLQQHGEMQWAARLTQALEENRFQLYYQSIIPTQLDERHSDHYEILIRLQDRSGEPVPPGAFIPAAERYNLMHLIDSWVIRTVFSTLGTLYRQTWEQCQQTGQDCLYTINLSGSSMNDDEFMDFLQEQFRLYQVPPQVICFEITETIAIRNLGRAVHFMETFRKLGCRFALDDFGSGMSSFAYLKNLPVDYVKIDGGFVKDMLGDPTYLAIVEAINQVGHALGLKTIAEFVENDAILQKLRAMGVDYAQGYGIAQPKPLIIPQGSDNKSLAINCF